MGWERVLFSVLMLSPFLFSDINLWQLNFVVPAYETDDDDEEECGYGNDDRGKSTAQHERIEAAAHDGGHGIDVFLENHRLDACQRVAYYTASNACYAAHHDSYPHRLTAVERLLQAGNGEKCQAEGVKEEPGSVHLVHQTAEYLNKHYGKEGAEEIHGTRHPEWRLSEHAVA